jgi:hypothetical protein
MAPGDFQLVDLISQGRAVERLLAARTTDEKLAWLARHGTLSSPRQVGVRVVYDFQSRIGRTCVFFLDGDTFVFVGDHSTFTAPE